MNEMTRRTNRRLLVCAALLSALSLPATVSAQSPEGQSEKADAAAAEHAKKGQVAYDLQDWATAAREYEAAYKLDQKPGYLWVLAQVQRLSGKCSDAIRTYKAFQRAGVSTNQANTAELMVTKCEAEIAKEEAAKAKAASSEGEEPASTPAAPGAPPPPEEDSVESSGGLGIGWFLTGAGLTVALGAATTWSVLDMKSKSSDYEDAPTKERYDEGKDTELRSNILIAATGVAAAGTIVLAIFTDWSGEPSQPEQPAVRVRPVVGTNGGALFLTGAF
jgi:hypothetical protein